MFIKIKPLKKIALIVACVWTVIITFLTVNLILSSENNAKKMAIKDAESINRHFLDTSSWLLKGHLFNHPNPNSKLPIRKGNMSFKDNVLLLPIERGEADMFLIFAKLDSKNQTKNNKLKQWQGYLLEQLITKKKKFSFVEKTSENEFVRAVEPLVIDETCNLCKVFKLQKAEGIVAGIFVSVDMSSYLAKSYAHISSMIRNIAVIWILGLAAIIYGYRKTSSAVAQKLKDYEENIFNLVDIIEKRDSYTAGHTQRVAKYAMLIADKLNISDYHKDRLYRASMLHDIGKISTPDSILLKPGKLSELEYKIIKDHVTTSYEILSKVTIYQDIAEIVRHHHEYYDGSGYPQGLKSDQIPFLSQIITVADGFDAMTTDRIYKGRKSVAEALAEISQLSGRQFNPIITKIARSALSNVSTDRNISQLPESDLQHERFSYFYKDNITSAYNQCYLELLLSKQKHQLKKYSYALLIQVHNFTQYNAEHSWSKGDEKLTEIVAALQSLEETHLVFRVFGDDFVLLLKNKIKASQRERLLNNECKDTCLHYSTHYIDLHERTFMNMDELEKIMHRAQ